MGACCKCLRCRIQTIYLLTILSYLVRCIIVPFSSLRLLSGHKGNLTCLLQLCLKVLFSEIESNSKSRKKAVRQELKPVLVVIIIHNYEVFSIHQVVKVVCINGGGSPLSSKGRSPRPEGPRAGSEVVGEGTTSPGPHQLGSLGERCNLPSGVPGNRRFWCLLGRQKSRFFCQQHIIKLS